MILRLHHSLGNPPNQIRYFSRLSSERALQIVFCFQLLSTPFHNNAVTFSCGVLSYAGRDLHAVDKLPL